MQIKPYKQWKSRLVSSAKEARTPVSAQFELTGRCNLDCKMCYVHNLDTASCLARELSAEEWKRIFDEAIQKELLFAMMALTTLVALHIVLVVRERSPF